jgi:hypothetical protein
MSDETSWRTILSDEAAVIRSILTRADALDVEPLIADLDGALVANETMWILDVKVSNDGVGVDLLDGPFPARAFVPSSAEYRGEVIIWITDGHISGLEYAWVSDDPPTRWPREDEMEVVRCGQAPETIGRIRRDDGQSLHSSRQRADRAPQRGLGPS